MGVFSRQLNPSPKLPAVYIVHRCWENLATHSNTMQHLFSSKTWGCHDSGLPLASKPPHSRHLLISQVRKRRTFLHQANRQTQTHPQRHTHRHTHTLTYTHTPSFDHIFFQPNIFGSPCSFCRSIHLKSALFNCFFDENKEAKLQHCQILLRHVQFGDNCPIHSFHREAPLIYLRKLASENP